MKYIEEIYKKRRIDTRWEKVWVSSFFGGLACIIIYALISIEDFYPYDLIFLVLGVLLIVFAGLMFVFSIEVLEKKYKVLEIEEEDSQETDE